MRSLAMEPRRAYAPCSWGSRRRWIAPRCGRCARSCAWSGGPRRCREFGALGRAEVDWAWNGHWIGCFAVIHRHGGYRDSNADEGNDGYGRSYDAIAPWLGRALDSGRRALMRRGESCPESVVWPVCRPTDRAWVPDRSSSCRPVLRCARAAPILALERPPAASRARLWATPRMDGRAPDRPRASP